MFDLTLVSDGPITHSVTHFTSFGIIGAGLILLFSFGFLLLLRQS